MAETGQPGRERDATMSCARKRPRASRRGTRTGDVGERARRAAVRAVGSGVRGMSGRLPFHHRTERGAIQGARRRELSERERSEAEYGDVTLAVIAGGKGERLGGVAKGLLEGEGRPVLARLLELGRRFEEVLLVANEPGPYAGFEVRTVGDVVRGRGAPGGVHAALAEARTPWVLAVACDMPFVEEGAVRRLLEERGEEVDAVCFTVGGRVEPLLGVYRRELAEPWGEVLKREEPSLRSLLSRCRTKLLPEEALREVDEELRSVVSVNTREDLERYCVNPPSPSGRGSG